MKVRISAWAILNPIPVSVLFFFLIAVGVIGYRALPVKLYPDTSFPVVQVSVTLPDAAVTEVEKQVTRVVEAAVSNVPGVKHVTSSVSLGSSSTMVEFEIGQNAQKVTEEVRSAIDRIRSALPSSVPPPIVEKADFDAIALVTYAVSSSSMSDVDLTWFIEDIVGRKLLSVEGVGQVKRIGGVERDVTITLDPAKMQSRGLTAVAVNEALKSYQTDNAGGRSEIGGREQTMRVLGTSASVEALSNMVVATSEGRELRLKDIATVFSGASDRRGYATLDESPVVGFQVMKTKASSDVNVEQGVKRALEQLSTERPDVAYHLIVSTATNTKQNFDATVSTLIEGIALAAIVVFIFLKDWRSTLISAVAMPLSLIPTFAVIHLLGFTLNMLSLLGLTLVIGVLVDDAIVEVENIQKRVQSGQSPWQAAFEGADAIGLAVVATTFAIAVVFLPVAFMKGVVGPYFREFGLTVAIAVMFSLVVARLLTPLMAAYLMTPSSLHQEPKAFRGRYRAILEMALANRWKSIGTAVALFVVSIGLASLLPTGFSPGSDSGVVQIAVQGPPGATLDDMRSGTKALTAKLKSYPDVGEVFVTLGTSGRDGDPRIGTAIVLLKKERKLTTKKFQEAIQPSLMSIPDIKLSFGESEDGSTVNTQVILTSDDVPLLAETTRELVRQMSSLTMLTNVMEVTPRPGNELVIRLKDSEAARLGVTPDALASVARIASMGDIDSNAAKLNEGQRRLPIRVRLPDAVMRDIEAISALRVPTRDGHTVPLSAVANVTFEAGPSSLERFDRMRRATVQAQVVGASLGQANAAVERLPLMKSLPQGVHRQLYGETENLTELFANFASAMAAGIGLIYGVLVLLFRSFFKPLTILTALPLSLAGAFVALLLTGGEMNLPVLIGLLMLMGLAAKNSILLVEHAIEAERAGMSQEQALLDAAHERSRPIVMTTIAMAAGMVPAALGLGGASDFRQPLAIAVIGGLISSTLLSLVLVPVFYGLVEDFENWLKPKLSKFVTPQTASDIASLRQMKSPREG